MAVRPPGLEMTEHQRAFWMPSIAAGLRDRPARRLAWLWMPLNRTDRPLLLCTEYGVLRTPSCMVVFALRGTGVPLRGSPVRVLVVQLHSKLIMNCTPAPRTKVMLRPGLSQQSTTSPLVCLSIDSCAEYVHTPALYADRLLAWAGSTYTAWHRNPSPAQ